MTSAKKSTSRDLPKVPELRAAADPTALIVTPALAVEIGLDESIMLRQLAYLIKTSQHERDGQYWTYQSGRKMGDRFFPFWSKTHIDRLIRRLADGYREGDRKIDGLGLVAIRTDLNRRKSDRTRWFALNVAAIERLESVTVAWVDADPEKGDADDSGVAPNGGGLPPMGAGMPPMGATLPKTTSKTTTKESIKDSTAVKESIYDDDDSKRNKSSSSAPAKPKRSNQKPLLKTPKNGKTDPLIKTLAGVCDLSEESEKVAEAAGMIRAQNLGGPREVMRWFNESWSREMPPSAKRPRPWAGQVVDGMKRKAERDSRQTSFNDNAGVDCEECGEPIPSEESTCSNCGRELAPFETV